MWVFPAMVRALACFWNAWPTCRNWTPFRRSQLASFWYDCTMTTAPMSRDPSFFSLLLYRHSETSEKNNKYFSNESCSQASQKWSEFFFTRAQIPFSPIWGGMENDLLPSNATCHFFIFGKKVPSSASIKTLLLLFAYQSMAEGSSSYEQERGFSFPLLFTGTVWVWIFSLAPLLFVILMCCSAVCQEDSSGLGSLSMGCCNCIVEKCIKSDKEEVECQLPKRHHCGFSQLNDAPAATSKARQGKACFGGEAGGTVLWCGESGRKVSFFKCRHAKDLFGGKSSFFAIWEEGCSFFKPPKFISKPKLEEIFRIFI